MYQQKLLFWVSLYFYLISIYSIIVSIWLFLEGQSAYFYTFLAIYSIDKLITLFALSGKERQHSKSKIILFWISDLFSLGFIYIFFCEKFFFSTTGCINTKAFIRVFPQIIIEFIFFFCLGQLQNTQIQQLANIASFFNFILFTLLYATLLSIVIFKDKQLVRLRKEKNSLGKNIKTFVKQFIFTLTYLVTLCSLNFYKDALGINLNYYQILLVIIDLIVLLLYEYYKKQQLKFGYHMEQLTYVFAGIKDLNKIVKIINYFNQVSRVVLLLVYSLQILPDVFQNQDDVYYKIQFSLTISSLLMSLIYFLFFFQNVLNFFIKYKYFQVKQFKDFDIVTHYLNKKFKYVKQIEINVYKMNNQNNKHLLQQPILKEKNQQILLLLQAISFQLKLNVRICLNYDYLNIDNLEILTSVECLFVQNYSLKYKLNQIIQHKIHIDDIIFERLENGFIENSYTNYLLTLNKVSNKKQIENVIASRYQITAYYKCLAKYIQFKPHETVFDLYDF